MKIVFFDVQFDEKQFLEPKLSEHQLIFSNQSINTQNFTEENKDANIISCRSMSKIDQKVIGSLSNLKLIVTRTTGFDHIDLKAAAEKNIAVCNVPSYGEHTVAEFAMALILALSRKVYQSINRTKIEHRFENDPSLQGSDLSGKTLGVIGTGRIGKHVIKMGQGFEMKVVGYDAFPNNDLQKELNFQYLGLDDLLLQSDIITIHVPNLPTTEHMINQDNFRKIKKGALLINTARGAVVETESLIQALDQGILAGAGLDVLEVESLDEKSDAAKLNLNLLGRDNVIITPHNAFNSKEAVERILETTVNNIEHFLSGDLQNAVKLNL